MGGGGSRISPPPPIPRLRYYNSLTKKSTAPLSVQSVVLSRKDPRQQWQIVLQPDKKYMKLRNVANGKFLYLGLEPLLGTDQFSTVDLSKSIDGVKSNYKYSPVFSKVTDDDIDNATTFTFISSFGPQMDIIDKSSTLDKSNITLSSKQGNRLTLTSKAGSPIVLFGIFIYAKNGSIINKDNSKVYSSSVKITTLNNGRSYCNESNSRTRFGYWGQVVCNFRDISGYATNALKIVNNNTNRVLQQAMILEPLQKTPSSTWNNSSQSPLTSGVDLNYCAMTKLDGTGVGGGDVWEYDNTNSIDLSLIEIYGDVNFFGMDGMKVELFNDTVSDTVPVWTYTISKNDFFQANTKKLLKQIIIQMK